MNGAKISVIIPVYNVEKYLDRCVNSVLNQTYKNLEIILVDDGSPDNSGLICDKYAELDNRVIVIHKTNGGLSSARNAGLEVAKGEYIGFVDSDDWIEKDMYEYLYKLIQIYDCDYSSINMMITKEENCLVNEKKECIKVMRNEELYHYFFRVSTYNIHYCVCDKLFKKNVISKFRFWEGMRFEDIDFNFKILKECKKAVYSNRIEYYYFYNPEGITRNRIVPSDMQLIDIWKKIVTECADNFPQYEYYARMNYERAHMGLLGKSIKYGVDKSFINWEIDKKQLLKKTRKYFKELIFWHMPFSRKVLLVVICINPMLLELIYRAKEKI